MLSWDCKPWAIQRKASCQICLKCWWPSGFFSNDKVDHVKQTATVVNETVPLLEKCKISLVTNLDRLNNANVTKV